MGNLKQNTNRNTMRTFITLALFGLATSIRINEIGQNGDATAFNGQGGQGGEGNGQFDAADEFDSFGDEADSEFDGKRKGKKGKGKREKKEDEVIFQVFYFGGNFGGKGAN